MEHYDSEREREVREVRELPDEEEREVREVLHEWGMAPEESGPVVQALRKRPTAWVDFMMRFELGLEKPDPGRAVRSAGTIAASYVVGGLIPLFPYMVINVPNRALMLSVVVTLIALGVFGYVKGRFTGLAPLRSASQTVVIGALAAGAAFVLAKIISK